jgi:hypothetical protein
MAAGLRWLSVVGLLAVGLLSCAHPSTSGGSTAAGSSPSPSVETRVVGLGDSVPAAAGCACTSFVELFGHDASPGGNPTRLLAPDGDHPNQAGHDLIAATVAAAGYAPLS